MPPVLFPSSTAPGKDYIESAGRLINAYAEKLQSGGPAQLVIRRTPGLTLFSDTNETGFRGMWYDGESFIYAAFEDSLIRVNSLGQKVAVGTLESGGLTFLTSLTDGTNQLTYTYAGVAIGTAHFNRRIIVAVMYDDPTDWPATVSVGGVAATAVAGSSTNISLFIALVPTGTTADIAVGYATSANRSAIGVFRLDGALTNTPHDTNFESGAVGVAFREIHVPHSGVAVAAARNTLTSGFVWESLWFIERFDDSVEAAKRFSGATASTITAVTKNAIATDSGVGGGSLDLVVASWRGGPGSDSDNDGLNIVTFAKNNKVPDPDQVLSTISQGAYVFTATSLTELNVAGTVTNSVCFGEGYFFFTTPEGRCYASGINDTTVNSLDSIRVEQRPEPLVRGVFYNGELYLFARSHIEVWASRGNPNPTGFPLNYVTSIGRGLVATLAVTGFEEGFEGGMFWVADDHSVRMLQGYQPKIISTPALERAIEACTNKTNIRAFVYDIDGHACVVIDLAGEATWVYDITEGGLWHERDTAETGVWRATGNSVRAWGEWICGDHNSGDLYRIDETAMDDGGEAMPFIVESIAMEAFPARLKVSRFEANFVSGVGNAAVPNPEIKISWSDTGGHTWVDPLTRRLGEDGRYYEQVRVNGLGLTGIKGRRFRLRIDDEVEVGLLAGSMEVATL